MTGRQFRGITISGLWVLLIVTPLLAVVLWVAINYANDQRDRATHAALVRQYEGSIKACRRGNVVRLAVRANSRIISEFLVAARVARLAAVKSAPTRADRNLNSAAARTYTRLIANVRPVPIIDCSTAYVKP